MNSDTSKNGTPLSKSVSELAAWRKERNGCRLLLPSIQRSTVWRNAQIINYWDSLLRGYPAGMMMIHKATANQEIMGVDAQGHTSEATAEDFLLFDGQQRMATILLGLDDGQFREDHRLWIDLGTEPKPESGLKFQLRMTTPGQPFGYKPESPNEKVDLKKRKEKWKTWQESTNAGPREAFNNITGGEQLIDSVCAVPISKISLLLDNEGEDKAIAALLHNHGAQESITRNFVRSFATALKSKVYLQEVNPEIVENEDEYIRFFERLGQGGTRLTDEELTYSIIKHHYPIIRDKMDAITKGAAGRLCGEVDLVLATLRVAKTLSPWEKAKEWEIIGKPNPKFVSLLNRDEEKNSVKALFLSMLTDADSPRQIQQHLENLRAAISYDSKNHPTGLPAILLARLPAELVDVLILVSEKKGDATAWLDHEKKLLTSFVLYWLLFVSDDAGAAYQSYAHICAPENDWKFSENSLKNLTSTLEKNNKSHYIPVTESDISTLKQGVKNKSNNAYLCGWHERFNELDKNDEYKPGEALRILSANDERIKRTLLWLQREYITKEFGNYDPTSNRDEDLPVDLDHIIPKSKFSFNWRDRNSHLTQNIIDNKDLLENFRWQRYDIGNMLGNFRWLNASENRSRQDTHYSHLSNGDDFVNFEHEWNYVIGEKSDSQWNEAKISKFQYLITSRTLDLYERVILESGISGILSRPSSN